MQLSAILLSLLHPITLATALSPLENSNNIARQFAAFQPCPSCFRSTWTHGPDCTTQPTIVSVLRRITNPPPSAISTYTASSFCSEYLQQTDINTIIETSTGISTYTTWTVRENLVTVTDLTQPTSTKFCPIPSPGMTCGISNPNIIAPADQGEDWSLERGEIHNPVECHQACLQHPLCKAYRVVEDTNSTNWDCEIFNVGLGINGSNVISASKGDQWWDRDCQVHLETGCQTASISSAAVTSTLAPTVTSSPQAATETTFSGSNTSPSIPTMTAGPTLMRRHAPRAAMVKRDTPLPPYLSDLQSYYSHIFVQPACSCLITSAFPVTSTTTTVTVPEYTASTTVSSTFVDNFTVTVTPRSTTIFQSIS